VRRTTYGITGAVAVTAAAFSLGAGAQQPADNDPGNDPFPPFQIAEGLYYVGASDYAAYLIATNDGLIVIDGGDRATGRQVVDNIRTLGFDPARVKILLNSHQHFDHAAGLAEIKKVAPGARLHASRADGEIIEAGGKGDPFIKGARFEYEPVKVDRFLNDKDKVSLGGWTLTANITGGHTRGCTTWTFPVKVKEGPRMNRRQALVHCSSSVLPGYRLVGLQTYPGQRADYEKSYRFWRSAKCDVFLASHGQFFGMKAKRATGASFVDPEGCKAYFERAYQGFKAEVAKQEAAAK
jgi:metallo-beta-lactamase class B